MKILNQIAKKKPTILVIGDLMLDRYIFGNVNRISPEAPVPIVKFFDEKFMLGGCGNVIRNLKSLGVETSIISVIGQDLAGQKIMEYLNDKNLSTSGVMEIQSLRTTEKMRILAESQQIVRVDWDSKEFDEKNYKKLLEMLPSEIEKSDGIIISDYGKGFCKKIILKDAIKIAQNNDIPVFIDPKGIDWIKYRNANFITPNTKEAEAIIGHKLLSNKDFEKAGKQICKTFNINSCLITRGKDGMSYVDNNMIFHLRSEAKEIFDVSGAGDTVIAALSLGLVSGAKPKAAAEFANRAAGIVVGHIGTSAITIEELKNDD